MTADQRDYVFAVLEQDDSPFLVVATTSAVARVMVAIDRELLPDPADRSIAATAIATGLPLVTSDQKLRKAIEGLQNPQQRFNSARRLE